MLRSILYPPLQRVRRRIVRAPHGMPRDGAGVEVEPGETSSTPRAIFLDDELDRIRGVQPDTDLAHELARVRGRTVRHGATRMWRLGEARLIGGTVYARGAYEALTPGGRPWWRVEPPVELDEALLCSSPAIERYFGHWLPEACPSELLARDRGLAPLAPEPLHPRQHEAGYRDLYGLADPKRAHARVRELWIADDHHMNPGRVRRIEELRACAQRAAGPQSAAGIVFFLRRDHGAARRLVNEEELAASLAAQGAAVVDPANDRVEDIVRCTARARLAIGVEGSALAHAVMALPRGATIVALEPPRRFNNIYKDYADALGLRYAFTVGDERDGDAFHVDPARLDRLLERVEAATAIASP